MPLPPGFERAFFDITNEDRVRNGLPKLSLSEALSRIAKQRSQEVLQPGNFSHYVAGTNQLRFAILLGEAKFPYSFAGENIEENNLVNLEKNLDYANQDFMNSPEHRENILNQRFTEVGVGVFGPDSNYRVAYAQIFAQVK